MNILYIAGSSLTPRSNNANLAWKIIPYLSRYHSVFLSASSAQGADSSSEIDGYPVFWEYLSKKNLSNGIDRLVSKIVDPQGYSDAVQVLPMARHLKKIYKTSHFDLVFSTMEPFYSACAALMLPNDVMKVLYIMDPPACTCNPGAETPYRHRMLPKILAGHDLILTTPFIREALTKCGFGRFDHKIAEVGFPMIESHSYQKTPDDIIMDGEKINLLFCGWLYSDIRSPQYFLDIASRLDERFCIYFMGKECDKLQERFSFDTRAQVITLPQQPYQVALNAMADADILINIGNSIPVHMPSKTLEYINTGKPMVNFHKLTDCPTLHYTNRYPLCLNIWEGERDMQQAADAFIRFCIENKGRTVDTASLKTQLPECTPEYIAKLILEKIGAHYE